jgi:hypothetical protein
MDFQELSDRFDKITTGLNSEIDRIFETMKPDFVEANRRAMMRGEKSDGTKLSVLRNPFYVDYKDSKGSFASGLNPPRSDLFDAGDFQKSMKATIAKKDITIFATDSKTSKLLAKEGEDMFGVQERELPKLREKFNSHLYNYLDAIVL